MDCLILHSLHNQSYAPLLRAADKTDFKMVEGHIESYLSVCVFVWPESCPGHNIAVHDGI